MRYLNAGKGANCPYTVQIYRKREIQPVNKTQQGNSEPIKDTLKIILQVCISDLEAKMLREDKNLCSPLTV